MNIIINDGYSRCCPNCFSNDLIKDYHHDELFCNECGLVVMDNTFQSFELFIYSEIRQSELDKQLQIDDIDMTENAPHTYGDLFKAINEDIAEKKKHKKAKAR